MASMSPAATATAVKLTEHALQAKVHLTHIQSSLGG